MLAAALGAMVRQAEQAAANETKYGRRTGPNTFERHEGGVPITSLVIDAPDGTTAVYEVVGVDARDLI